MSKEFYQTSILPYAGIIIKICRAYSNSQEDFEDNYQEVCLQIWRSRKSYKGDSSWSTWIYRLSLYVCMTIFKKESKRNGIERDTDSLPEQFQEDSNAFSDESLNHLYAAIRLLSETDRAIILLYLEEKPYQEIASIIGTNANNIAVKINRIKTKLKKLLDGKIN